VRYKEGSRVADLVPQIKMLVADGVSGLAYEKVSVVMVPAALPDAGIAAASEMQNVFGLWIYGGSAAFVRFMIACLAGLGAGVLAVAGLAGWRLRHRVIAFGREKQHLLLR
jgi:type III secretion protein J